MKRVLLILSVNIVVIGSAVATAAADATTQFQLQIGDKQCSVDTLDNGVSQTTSLAPPNCSPAEPSLPVELPPSNTIQLQNSSSPAQAINDQNQSPRSASPRQISTTTNRPGDQGIAENTPLEPIASWLGVGNRKASSARPIIAVNAFILIMLFLIDAAFLEFRYVRAILSWVQRRLSRSDA